MKIFLIGFMGAGKTTLGAMAAQELNIRFFDTDQLIEEETGMNVSEIFKRGSEDEFRKMEASLLRRTQLMDRSIIACGGGLPLYDHNMEWMLEHGVTMYLQVPDEILLANLVHHRTVRPLLSGLSEEEAIHRIMQLLKARKPVYERASMTLGLCGEIEKDALLLIKACRYIL